MIRVVEARNWWYITELAQALDKALGPTKKSGEPRVITGAVLDRLRKVWVERSNEEAAGEVDDATGEAERADDAAGEAGGAEK